MGVMTFRPGQRLVIPGAQVFTPRTSSAVPSGGWWDNNGAISGCVAAYQPKGATDLASSYINLANPGTYNAAPGVAPTFSAAGWEFNGSAYLTTGIVPSSSWTMILRFSDRANANVMVGSRTGIGMNMYYLSVSAAAVVYSYGNASSTISPTETAGVIALAGATGYRNGISDASLSGAFGGSIPAIIIGGLNNNGTPASFTLSKFQAFAVYNITLSAGSVATIATAMNAL